MLLHGHERAFVDAFHAQAAAVTPPSQDASPAVPCFPRHGDRVALLRWWTLGWPRRASRCVCSPLRPRVCLSHRCTSFPF